MVVVELAAAVGTAAAVKPAAVAEIAAEVELVAAAGTAAVAEPAAVAERRAPDMGRNRALC